MSQDMLSEQDKHYYAMLDALDAKSSAILQIASIYLVVLFLEPFRNLIVHQYIYKLSVLAIIGSIIPHFFILWFSKKPSRLLVNFRIMLFNFSVLSAFLAIVLSMNSINIADFLSK